jgi:hypothetical protein
MQKAIFQQRGKKDKKKRFWREALCFLYQLERVMGIEPTHSAWEADILPLNYTRMKHSAIILAQSFFVGKYIIKIFCYKISFSKKGNSVWQSAPPKHMHINVFLRFIG